MHYDPWGIVDVDPSKVSTNGKAGSYDVYPGMAGLLQLIKDGSIKVQGERSNEAHGVPVPEGDYRRMGVFQLDAEGKRVRVKQTQ